MALGEVRGPGLGVRSGFGTRDSGARDSGTRGLVRRIGFTARPASILQCSRGPTPARAASHLRARLQPQALLIDRPVFVSATAQHGLSDPESRAPSPEPPTAQSGPRGRSAFTIPDSRRLRG